MRLIGALTLLACLAVAGCSGGAGPKAATATPSKLGHFSTCDGAVKLVLDRTGPNLKMRVEGSDEVVELARNEVRNRVKSRLMGHDFYAKDGQRVLFIDVYGTVTFIRGRDELMVTRDGDAKPLGDATVIGTVPPGTFQAGYAAPR